MSEDSKELKLAFPTAEDIKKLKEKYPGQDLFKAEFADGITLVFRRPTPDEFDYFWDRFDPTSNAAGPAREFAEQCVVWPDAAQLQALSKQYASLSSDVAMEIRRKAGAGKVEVRAL